MKTRFRTWFFFIGVICISMVFLTDCKKDDKDDGATCVDTDNPCGSDTFKTCATTTSAYYQYNGVTYNCNGMDCQAAATALAAVLCAKSSKGSGDTERLILERTRIVVEASASPTNNNR